MRMIDRILKTPADWQPFVLPATLDAYPAGSAAPVGGHGIYALFSARDELVYVGKSRQVSVRLNQHFYAARFRCGPKFSVFTCLELPEAVVSHVETAHIYALTPPLNLQYLPIGWASHKKMVDAIRKEWETQ